MEQAIEPFKFSETGSGTGNRETALGTGNSGTASGTGNRETALGTGNSGTASGTGNSGTASGTENRETASVTGNRETALGTGNRETALGTGNRETALGTGNRGTAQPPESHLFPTDVSRDSVASNHLDGPHISLSNNSQTPILANYLETQGGIYLDQNNRQEHNGDTNLSPEQDAQIVIEKSVTQVDDERLMNIIESADPHQAVQLLEGNNHFSQDGLDRALISACWHGLKYLVQTLVRLGANVQSKDTQGNNPLLTCAENGSINIVQFLLKKKADVNVFNSAGDTALILSIRAAGSLEMVRVLLEQEGIDISHQNQDGYTALMKAVEVGDVDVINILMERYNKEENDGHSNQASNPNCLKPLDTVNLKGKTAEQIAGESGFTNIYHILKAHLSTKVPLLESAMNRRDIDSLKQFLDCRFVLNHDIQDGFVKVIHIFGNKKGNLFSQYEFRIIKSLVESGIHLDTTGYFAYYLLFIAVKMGNYGLVELLCESFDKQQQMRSHCYSRKFAASVSSDRYDILKHLLKYNADINTKSNDSGSLPDSSSLHGHLESDKLLVRHGATSDIELALQTALTQQLTEYIKLFCENYQPEVTEGDIDLNKLLVSAARVGNLDMIGCLIDAGADVNGGNLFKKIPLLRSKDGNVARFLINRGANVSILLRGRKRLLTQILENSKRYNYPDMEIVKVLIENGASVNERGLLGKTPLMIAARRMNNVSTLQVLLDHGADINAKDNEGNTALMAAIRCNINVTFLLKFHKDKNLNINEQNHKGKSALMYAVWSNDPAVVKTLIDFGADMNVRDVKGNTALVRAAMDRYVRGTDILTSLIRAGSDVNSQNNDGFSPLMLAAVSSHKDAIEVLLNSGANVNAVSGKNDRKTALTFLSLQRTTSEEFKACLQLLLSKGASLAAGADASFLQRMILFNEVDVIHKVIQCGVGPADIEPDSLIKDIARNNELFTVSPLCVALLVGNLSLARYFVENMFLTHSDVTSLTGNKALRSVLERRRLQDCLTFLDELSSQQWSLFELTFVSVSSAVGSLPGRENRVNMLPLPQVMKDKLLFKSRELQLSVYTKVADY